MIIIIIIIALKVLLNGKDALSTQNCMLGSVNAHNMTWTLSYGRIYFCTECDPSKITCNNGGQCTTAAGVGLKCSCVNGYSGPYCDVAPPPGTQKSTGSGSSSEL